MNLRKESQSRLKFSIQKWRVIISGKIMLSKYTKGEF